jgi:hypothetical protein
VVPFPLFARRRDERPVHHTVLLPETPIWLVTRHEDVSRLMEDDRFGGGLHPTRRWSYRFTERIASLVEVPDEHERGWPRLRPPGWRSHRTSIGGRSSTSRVSAIPAAATFPNYPINTRRNPRKAYPLANFAASEYGVWCSGQT